MVAGAYKRRRILSSRYTIGTLVPAGIFSSAPLGSAARRLRGGRPERAVRSLWVRITVRSARLPSRTPPRPASHARSATSVASPRFSLDRWARALYGSFESRAAALATGVPTPNSIVPPGAFSCRPQGGGRYASLLRIHGRPSDSASSHDATPSRGS